MSLKPPVAGDALVKSAGAADVDAELVLAEAGGDVGVGIGKDVGVDAESKARRELELAGTGSQKCKFCFAFDVELKDAGVQREVNLRCRFANSGEDDAARRIRCGREDALQFAAGDDVESCATASQKL